MKRYARKKPRATKKVPASGGTSPSPQAKKGKRTVAPKKKAIAPKRRAKKKALTPKTLTSSEKARIIWLKRNQVKAEKICAKKRPSEKDLEELKVLTAKIKKQKAVISGKAPAKPKRIPLSKVQTEALSRKRKAKVAETKVVTRFSIAQKELQKSEKALAEASNTFRARQAKIRIALYEQYTSNTDQMKARLLELRDGAIKRGELERPSSPFRRVLNRRTHFTRGQIIHVPGGVFLNDPGVIEQIMFDARAQSLKLTPKIDAKWLATLSMLVYGQAMFGSPPRPSLAQIPDASLFQVQSYESTGLTPTRLGMLDLLEDRLQTGAEIPRSVVWLEFITLQQFLPSDGEEKKEWRRAYERRMRKLATQKKRVEAKRKKRQAFLRKKRREAAKLEAQRILTSKKKSSKRTLTSKKSPSKKTSKKKTVTKRTLTPKKRLLKKPRKKSTTKSVVKKKVVKKSARVPAKAKAKVKAKASKTPQKKSSSNRSKAR